MKSLTHANRGMGLESLIEYANAQYAAKGIAQIQKVSTPWKVIRKGKQIVSAFPEKKSTVDFIGIQKGNAIAFDAKSTENKTSFPLSNVEQHQIDFMNNWEEQGGTAFLLIEFKVHKEIYFLPMIHLNLWFSSPDRKSIPYTFFNKRWLISQGDGVVLDYLKQFREVG